ncbi:hypothetical protein B4Q13_18490 [Lacticaseibacillus rhamnosus]
MLILHFAVPSEITSTTVKELRFAQITASPVFSAEGRFAGKTIGEVAGQGDGVVLGRGDPVLLGVGERVGAARAAEAGADDVEELADLHADRGSRLEPGRSDPLEHWPQARMLRGEREPDLRLFAA